jgi:50S ribosomal protein L16 3-hydroxylase
MPRVHAVRQNADMDLNAPVPLLGGLSATLFMRRHWQKKPLLVRQAWPDVRPPLPRAALFVLAAQDDVEARCVEQRATGWHVRQGPFSARALPPVSRAQWTLLVQGLDLQVPAAHQMLRQFRFVPDARLDDLMVSWASAGGGVGPHVDAYDVFLLQVQGSRRWRVGPAKDQSLIEGAPLKLLRHFEPTQEWLLAPGDMLYLPPGWGHDGVAEGGECMTCSIGFRAPTAHELVREMLLRLADEIDEDAADERRYADRHQGATNTPGAMPPGLLEFAHQALTRTLARHARDTDAVPRVMGEILTEPKPQVWFEAQRTSTKTTAIVLDPRTRMLYDHRYVFVNGQAWRAGGRDVTLMRRLADARMLSAADCARLSPNASALLRDWLQSGWMHKEMP